MLFDIRENQIIKYAIRIEHVEEIWFLVDLDSSAKE